MTQTTVTLQMLTEARSALHELRLGAAVVEVRDSNGESVRYQRTDSARLLDYIAYLERELGIESSLSRSTPPMRVWM